MTTEEKFRAAVNVIKNLPKNEVRRAVLQWSMWPKSGSYQPSHDLMLRFYAYFKQATEGPCKAPRPAFWEVVKKMKWDAWSRLGNMPREEAMDNYVEELKKIVETMSYTENVASFLGSLGSFYDHVPAEDLELLVGPVIERLRSQPGSPLGSREASPSRGPGGGVGGGAGGARMLSSLETSPASSYSASPLPPDAEDDDDEEDEFKDTLEVDPERFVKEVPQLNAGLKKPVAAVNGLSNGYAPALNGFGGAGAGAGGGHRVETELTRTSAPPGERGRPVARVSPPQPPPPQQFQRPRENGTTVLDIAEPIASVVARLQQDLQQVMGRLGSVERAMLARDLNSRNQKQSGSGSGPGAGASSAVVRRTPRWWPFRDLEPRSVVLLALWPIIIHLMFAWLQRRRQTHFSA